MKTFVSFAVLLTTALSAPAPAPVTAAEGVSFPITDLLGTDLTIKEYTQQLEDAQRVEEFTLTKRQYGGDTYNQLTDGTACRAVTVIWARGTTQEGNVGTPDSEGPTFFNNLASRLGGTSRLAIQGVTYPASIAGFLAGGDAAGSTTMYNLINTAASKCPSTKIVVSGYSQGAQLVHTATQRLSAAVAARVSAVVTFGDADRDETFGSVAASKILIICHDGDNICDNGIIITPAHRNYEIDAPAAAAFVATKV
ncbi:carbohydrate esterase family 5 protein [Dothidotthia symphoricarpi CBS 119687]|uniref:Cutinase n=1 Tax=Dothidotthia symphoricarpi CBS 119687 TaxID=1392245 RepID=A0A6A6APQ3_9PLEO|nr:carbohydrate esterase family 5 protein [Dothidotthia symphoricarpi CBS 119687]KAF2133899.1 carbohydrate esterase family 5 protein [Dothidotthia symphoricarpi CBS 119687]